MSSAGYSRTPLARKLGYKSGISCFLQNPPTDYDELVAPLPENVSYRMTAEDVDLVHVFSKNAGELAECLPALMGAIDRDGMIWVSWPKRASKIQTDVTENVIRQIALPLGLVDIKVCAVDETWSGLKLVIRKELR